MPMQIVRNSSALGRLGDELGAGLASGLSALAENKFKEMEGARFWRSLNLPEDKALAFARAPESVQKSLLDRLEGLSLGANQQAQPGQQQTSQFGQLAQQQEQPGYQNQPGQITLGPTKEERRHRETLAQQKEIAQHKASKDVVHEINQKAKAAKEDLRDLDRLEELQNSGKLDSPGYHEFLTRSGLDISALRDPSSEEFQKIQANFIRNAKNYFGARISNYEVENFLKAIPTLSNSNAGRSRIFANLKRIARGAQEYNEAYKEVIKENKGIPPFDLESKIDDKIDKRLDRVAEDFRKDLAKPVPKEQNRLVTALQAITGSALGLPGAIVGGAGKAANAIGSAAGLV